MPNQPSPRLLGIGIGSARDVLLATVIAGAIGYAITVAAGAVLGNPGYLPFATFWSALFLIVGVLSGVQHESTRAARPVASPASRTSHRVAVQLFVVTALATGAIVGLSAPFWVPRAFPQLGTSLLWPMLVGAIGYLALCVGGGILAGLASWRLLGIITIADNLLRLIAVGIALALGSSMTVLAWCIALPFGAVGVVSALLVQRLAGQLYVITDRLRSLLWNVVRTTATGAAMGLLIAGFPLLLAIYSGNEDPTRIAAIAFVANLVRSPLIVLTMSFQLVLVQRFRDSTAVLAQVVRLLAVLAGAGAVLTILASAFGSHALELIFGGEYQLTVSDMTVLVASAAPVAGMFVTGAALLGQGHHGAYFAGWATSAALAVAALALPVTLTVALPIALLVSPAIGMGIHVIALARLLTATRTKNAVDQES